MSRWDEDVERPTTPPTKDLRHDVDALKHAVNSPPPPTPAPIKHSKATFTPKPMTTTAAVDPTTTPERFKKLREEAIRSAENTAARFKKKTVVIRAGQGVSGWYPGSVPRVDEHPSSRDVYGSFPHAPSVAPDTEGDFRVGWAVPFIARLRELGFEVHFDGFEPPTKDEEEQARAFAAT